MSALPPAPRAAVYLRAPTATDGLPPVAAQREAVAKFAATGGWRCTAEFIDADERTARGLASRPALVELFAAIARHEVDAVIVDTAAVLPPDPVQRALVLHELQRAGVALLDAACGGDVTQMPVDPETERVREVLAAANDFAGHPGVTALRQARPHRSALDRALAEIVRLRAGGTSLTTLARRLNALGLTDAQGAPWTRMSVFAVVRTLPQPEARGEAD